MLKWIASGCLVVILVVCAVAYFGYRQMKTIAANGPTVTVSMKATPERIFASMSHVDSLSTWMAPGMTFRTARKGTMAAGDTLFIMTRDDSVPRTAWVIDTVVPNQVIAQRWVVLRNGTVMYRRRDSIGVAGDSTPVISTVIASMVDSLAAARTQANGVSGGLLDMAATMGSAGGRIQAEQELRRLKLRIEGPPVSRP